jgi:hypothetical protein
MSLVANLAPAVQLTAKTIVYACAAYLAVLGVLTVIRPSLVKRFLDGHAATPQLNAVEAGLRLTAGLSFSAAAPASKAPSVFLVFGSILAVSGVALFFLYGAHRQFAAWSVPLAKRALPLLGALSLVAGGFFAWGVG